jgi:hypothetical protein
MFRVPYIREVGVKQENKTSAIHQLLYLNKKKQVKPAVFPYLWQFAINYGKDSLPLINN